MARRKSQRRALQHHFLLARLAPLDRLAHNHLDPGLAQRLQHRAAQRALLEMKKIEQFVVHQPHHMPLIDHHHALHHVRQQHVQVKVLLPLLALELLQPRAQRF